MKRTSLLQCDTQTLDRGNFAFKRKRLGADVGAKGLGTSWFELAPGKKAFPFHFHLANEEALFVLEGEGVLRSDKEEHQLRAGDYISFPPGPPGHQVINRSDAPLRFLALSTMIEPRLSRPRPRLRLRPQRRDGGRLLRGRRVIRRPFTLHLGGN
jgi:uncharacterized cupin superfamily protein